MPDYTPVLAQAAREKQRLSYLVRVGTATPFRVWSGDFDFATSADDELDPSAIYSGAGELLAIPALRVLVGGQAASVQLAFAADTVAQSWVDDADSDIKGADVNIGIVFFDDGYQAVAPVLWAWPLIAGPATSSYKSGRRVITLSCSTQFIDRSVAPNTMWSDSSHQSRHPGDSFFKWRRRYNLAYRPKWD